MARAMEYWSVGMLGLNASLQKALLKKPLFRAAQKDPEARRAKIDPSIALRRLRRTSTLSAQSTRAQRMHMGLFQQPARLEEPLFLQLPHHPVVDDIFDFELANGLAGTTE